MVSQDAAPMAGLCEPQSPAVEVVESSKGDEISKRGRGQGHWHNRAA